MVEWLASDFVAHDYAPRRIVRAIVLSRGYQLAAWPGENPPAANVFAAAAEKPLMAEAIARSARIASGLSPDDVALRQTFAETFPDVLPRVTRATIQQAMLLANSEKFCGLYSPESGNAPAILASLPSLEDRVRGAFQFTLTREPDAEELARGMQFLRSRTDKAADAAGQLLWALAAGPEFLTNH